MNAAYNKFRRFCAFATGAVLLISGILKLMDPTGAGLVVKAYFDFLHSGFMAPAAKTVAVVLALTEGVLGSMLMSGVWRKVGGIAAFAVMGFFTLVTVVLAIANPDMDCGCFGEAVHLTHLQSLVKNLVLDALLCIAYIPLRDLGTPKKVKYVSFGITSLSLAAFAIWSLIALPLKDYTDFAPGKVLAASDSEDYIDLAEPVFIYEKDGERKNFRIDNLPDSSWTFVDSRVVEDEFTRRPVLSITDRTGAYRDSLAADGQVMVVSLYRKPCRKNAEGIRTFLDIAASAGYTTLVLVADQDFIPETVRASVLDNLDDSDGLDDYDKDAHCGRGDMDDSRCNGDAGGQAAILVSDYKTLLTLNRSNGGVTHISDGQIVRKWSANFRPDSEKMLSLIDEDATSLALESSSRGSLSLQALLLYIFAVLLLL